MKFADVVIGAEYLTKISGSLVRVRTEGWREVHRIAKRTNTQKIFDVSRVDNGRRLVRTAGKLRPTEDRPSLTADANLAHEMHRKYGGK